MPFVVLGLIVGGLSGLLGLGGGIFLVPALIVLFHFTPPQAQGTSLAVLIPPIGLFAALEYYRKGLIEFEVVGLICLGFVLGASVGAFFVDRIPVTLLRRAFGFVMFFLALEMVLTGPDPWASSAVPATGGMGLLALISLLARRLGLALPRPRRAIETPRPTPTRIWESPAEGNTAEGDGERPDHARPARADPPCVCLAPQRAAHGRAGYE